MDSVIPAVIAGVAGLPLGWLVAAHQHRLYREPEFRAVPLSGKRALAFRAGLALAFAVTFALAFRPDHYEPLPALVTAAACAVMATVASTDFERRRIPNRVIYPALVGAAACAFLWPDRSALEVAGGAGAALAVAVLLVALGALLGGAVGAGTTAFGIGDAKLILLTGLLVGWPGVVSALFLGMVAGGVPAVVLLVTGGRRRAYSYGPYLAFGATVLLLWPGLS